jgi:hypothetical protein
MRNFNWNIQNDDYDDGGDDDKTIPDHCGPGPLTVKYNQYNLPHIYILPPDDGLLIRPKHVEVW